MKSHNSKKCNIARNLGSQNIFSDYAKTSTIHGIHYLGQSDRPIVERIWWLIVLIISLTVCGLFISDTYEKWNNNPVIVTLAEKSTPVQNIPFPAITICPETKFRRNIVDVEDIIMQLRNGQIPNISKPLNWSIVQNVVPQICNAAFDNLDDEQMIIENSIEEIIKYMAPNFDDILMKCLLFSVGNKNTCKSIFREVYTKVGLCYTFNGLMPNDLYRDGTVFSTESSEFYEKNKIALNWSVEYGYKNPTTDWYPYHCMGGLYGQFVLVHLQQIGIDFEQVCDWIGGFKLLLHSPSDTPLYKLNFMKLPLNNDVRISIDPKMTITASNLIKYSPKKRGCFFGAERYLRFFKIYTENNCFVECLANFTLDTCNCVFFYMPRLKSTPVCGIGSVQCGHLAREKMLDTVADWSFDNSQFQKRCNCMPACSAITYNAELYHSRAHIAEYIKRNLGIDSSEQNGLENKSVTLTIFYKDPTFIATKRSELFGRTEFIANIGGILGLFMGISLISFVEIIYFCTLRPFFSYRNKKNEENKSIKLMTDRNQVWMVRSYQPRSEYFSRKQDNRMLWN